MAEEKKEEKPNFPVTGRLCGKARKGSYIGHDEEVVIHGFDPDRPGNYLVEFKGFKTLFSRSQQSVRLNLEDKD